MLDAAVPVLVDVGGPLRSRPLRLMRWRGHTLHLLRCGLLPGRPKWHLFGVRHADPELHCLLLRQHHADLRRVLQQPNPQQRRSEVLDLQRDNPALLEVHREGVEVRDDEVRPLLGGLRVRQGPAVRGEGVKRDHDHHRDGHRGRNRADRCGYV